MIVCSKCHISKPTSNFYARRKKCKICYREQCKSKWNSLSPIEKLSSGRIARHNFRNKMTIEERKSFDRKTAQKYLSDNVERKIKHRLRCRLNQAVSGNFKKCSAVKDLGCSIEFLKEYLKSKFQEGMNWDNYGKWHIDHIYPLSRVDFNDIEQVKMAIHYTNLQPLWAIDNIKKSNIILY